VPRSVNVGVCVGQSGTGTGFPQSLLVYLCQYHSTIWGMNNMPVGGHSSETLSHPIYLNNNECFNRGKTWNASVEITGILVKIQPDTNQIQEPG
jgi:hypothetical protein